jgi:hypothetical protein
MIWNLCEVSAPKEGIGLKMFQNTAIKKISLFRIIHRILRIAVSPMFLSADNVVNTG